MKLRFAVFSLVLLLPTHAVHAGFSKLLNAAIPESTNKTLISFDDKKIAVEVIEIGTKRAMRFTYEDGAEQLMVQNAAGQFVPVHKSRKRVLHSMVTIAKYLSILALGGGCGAYALYHYGQDTAEGKRVIPTVTTMLRKLINSLPGDDSGKGSPSDTK